MVLVTPGGADSAGFVGQNEPEMADNDQESSLVGQNRPEMADKSGHYELIVSAGLAWNRAGVVESTADGPVARLPSGTYPVHVIGTAERDPYTETLLPHRVVRLDRPAAISTGRPRTLDDIRAALAAAERSLHARADRYGDLADALPRRRLPRRHLRHRLEHHLRAPPRPRRLDRRPSLEPGIRRRRTLRLGQLLPCLHDRAR